MHNGVMKYTESCHILYMILSEFFSMKYQLCWGFLAFLVAYCSPQYEEYIYHVSSKKAQCVIKIYVDKSWPVPAKQVGIYVITVCDFNIHYLKHWEENLVVLFKRKQLIMPWFDDWNKAWWDCTNFLLWVNPSVIWCELLSTRMCGIDRDPGDGVLAMKRVTGDVWLERLPFHASSAAPQDPLFSIFSSTRPPF